MIKQAFYISFFILLLPSCKNKGPYVLKGRLMANCGVPGANKEIIIYQDIDMFNNGGYILNDVYSDENGYFEIEYTPDNGSNLELGVSGAGSVLEFIPSHKNLDLGDVYYGSIPTNFVIRLDVKEPYSQNDTLVFRDFHSNNILDQVRIPGPFSSGIIDTVVDIGFSKYPIFYNQTPEQGFPFRISSDSSGSHWVYFDVDLCNSSYFGDAVMVIE